MFQMVPNVSNALGEKVRSSRAIGLAVLLENLVGMTSSNKCRSEFEQILTTSVSQTKIIIL